MTFTDQIIFDLNTSKYTLLKQKYPFFADNFDQIEKALTAFDKQIFNLIYSKTDYKGQTIEREVEEMLIEKRIPVTFAYHSIRKLGALGLLLEMMDVAGYLKVDQSYMPAPFYYHKSELGRIIFNQTLV